MTPRRCVFPGCGKKHHSKGHCWGHMNQRRNGWELRPLRPKSPNGVRDPARKPDTYRRFSMTEADYNRMLLHQNGVCAICNEPPVEGKKLVVDHDHACCPTKSKSCGLCVRQLLCAHCNSLLGFARDDVSTLENAIEYLNRHLKSP